MPNYVYSCEKCGRSEEMYAQITEDRVAPLCCDHEMYHDFARERFGGIANREKGTVYAKGFLETFENKAEGRHEQVYITSREAHMKELARRGLQQKGAQAPESVYRRKHAGDFVATQERQKRESS